MATKQAEAVTIGFAGTGEADGDQLREVLFANLENIDENAEIRLFFPVTTDLVTEEIEAMLDFAIKNADNGIVYEVFTTKESAKSKALQPYMNGDNVAKTHTVVDPLASMISALAKAPNAHLYVIEANDDVQDLMSAAEGESIPVYDLADGLRQVQLSYDQEQLEAMDRDELKTLAGNFGITTFPRKLSDLIAAILEAQGLEDESEGEEEAEEAAEPEEAPKTRRGRKPAPEPEPEEDEAEEAVEDATEDETEAVEGSSVPFDTLKIMEMVDTLCSDFQAALIEMLAEALESATEEAVEEEPEEEPAPAPRRRGRPPKAEAEPEPEEEAPKRSRGRPRKDGTPAQPRTGRKLS